MKKPVIFGIGNLTLGEFVIVGLFELGINIATQSLSPWALLSLRLVFNGVVGTINN